MKTPLFDMHQKAGASMVEFAGWQMPIHYGSLMEEHRQVRNSAGLFDVSHMVIWDVSGVQAKVFLQHLLASDVGSTPLNKAVYGCMLNAEGGVLDDLIVYVLPDDQYRMITNAGTREKISAWVEQQQKGWEVTVTQRVDLAMLAVQGPEAREKVFSALPGSAELAADLAPFHCVEMGKMMIARTGYTGEDGFELMMHAPASVMVWQALMAAGVKPIGLGARDTLRLEAGLNLYGAEMDETITPLESGLSWTVAWGKNETEKRDFIGREVLETQRQQGITQKRVGLVLKERGVLRSHQEVMTLQGEKIGEVTSGSFSPTLQCAIGLARVSVDMVDEHCTVMIRNKACQAKVVKPPFVRKPS
jgi:aminomethyltransferase